MRVPPLGAKHHQLITALVCCRATAIGALQEICLASETTPSLLGRREIVRGLGSSRVPRFEARPSPSGSFPHSVSKWRKVNRRPVSNRWVRGEGASRKASYLNDDQWWHRPGTRHPSKQMAKAKREAWVADSKKEVPERCGPREWSGVVVIISIT